MIRDESFPLLVWRLMQTKHKGNLMEMSARSGIAQSTVWRWSRGLITQHRPDLVKRLADTYDLEFTEVWALISRDTGRRLDGKRVKIPDTSDVMPGPKPRS